MLFNSGFGRLFFIWLIPLLFLVFVPERIRSARIRTAGALKKMRAPRGLIEKVLPKPRRYRKNLVIKSSAIPVQSVADWLGTLKRCYSKILFVVVTNGPNVFENSLPADPQIAMSMLFLRKWVKQTSWKAIAKKRSNYLYIAISKKGDLVLTDDPDNAIIGALAVRKHSRA